MIGLASQEVALISSLRQPHSMGSPRSIGNVLMRNSARLAAGTALFLGAMAGLPSRQSDDRAFLNGDPTEQASSGGFSFGPDEVGAHSRSYPHMEFRELIDAAVNDAASDCASKARSDSTIKRQEPALDGTGRCGGPELRQCFVFQNNQLRGICRGTFYVLSFAFNPDAGAIRQDYECKSPARTFQKRLERQRTRDGSIRFQWKTHVDPSRSFGFLCKKTRTE